MRQTRSRWGSHPVRNSGVRRGVLGVVSLLLAVSGAGAEELHSRFFRDVTVGSGVHYQHWNGEGDLSIQELSIPVTFILPVGKKLSLDLVTGTGFASLDQGESNSLGGLRDTKIRVSYVIGDELALLTAGLSTPTGHTGLDDQEQQVSAYLAQNALGFRTPNFGQGLDVNVGVATARKLGETVVGLGAGYLLKGRYVPQDGGLDYTPGSELSLTAGLDYKVLDGDGKLTLDVVYTLYGRDEREGRKVLQSGNKVRVQALALLRAGGFNWRFHIIERSKGKNTSYAGPSSQEYSNGNQLEGGLSLTRAISPSLSLRGLADVKVYGDNDFDRGEATMLGLGPGIRVRLSPGRFIDLNAKCSRGDIDGSTLSGIELGGGVWIEL